MLLMPAVLGFLFLTTGWQILNDLLIVYSSLFITVPLEMVALTTSQIYLMVYINVIKFLSRNITQSSCHSMYSKNFIDITNIEKNM